MSPEPVACGEPTALVAYPGLPRSRGALVGPLLFETVILGEDRAAINSFLPGHPTKVVMQRVRAVNTPLTLEGWECSSGQRLRFWYRECCPFPSSSLPVTEEQLASTGDLVATLPPGESSTPDRGYAYGGYMLFTKPGKWKVSVSQSGQLLGSIVVLVRLFPR